MVSIEAIGLSAGSLSPMGRRELVCASLNVAYSKQAPQQYRRSKNTRTGRD
jgi:hypothetical protein